VRKSFTLLLAACLFLPTSGCVTNRAPVDWSSVSTTDIGSVSLFLQGVLEGKITVDDRVKLCLATSGAAAALDFASSVTQEPDKKVRLLNAVKAGDQHAKQFYGDLYETYGGLDGIISHAMGVESNPDILDADGNITESEFILGLLNAIQRLKLNPINQ
jgi:hypothetical protein